MHFCTPAKHRNGKLEERLSLNSGIFRSFPLQASMNSCQCCQIPLDGDNVVNTFLR